MSCFRWAHPRVRAAFAATRTIPIVAHDLETDPVAAGYAQSYARPGGNLTGLFLDSPDLAGKWVELLKMHHAPFVARRGPVGFELRSDPASGCAQRRAFDGHQTCKLFRSPRPKISTRPLRLFRGRPQALIILPSPMLYFQSARLAQLARQATDCRPPRCSSPSRRLAGCWRTGQQHGGYCSNVAPSWWLKSWAA